MREYSVLRSCEWFLMFQGARALKRLKWKLQGIFNSWWGHNQRKKENSAKPKEGKEPFFCTWSRAEVLKMEPKCLFMYIDFFCRSTRGRIARDAWVFGILFTLFTPTRGYFKVMRRQNAATLLPIIQRCVLSGTEGFFFDRRVNFVFAFYVRWSWSWTSKDFSDAQLTLRRKSSDICFDTHMSVSFEFVSVGGDRFFWGSGYFNKSDIGFPVWSYDRAPKFYQLTMQCVNAQLN